MTAVATRTSGQLRGTTLTLCSAVAFGTSGPLAKAAMDAGVGPASVSTVRIGLAAVLVTVIIALGRPRALRFRRADASMLVGYGLLGVVGAQLLFFLAVDRIPVGVAMLLEFLAPAYVALWVRFVRHTRLRAAVWLGIGLALVGLAMVAQVWQGLTLDPLGLVFGVGSGLCTTGYFLIGERAQDRDPYGVLVAGLLIGTVVVSVVAPPWDLPFATFGVAVPLGGALLPLWLVLVLVAALSTALAYGCGLAALAHLSPAVASVVGLLEPVTAAVLAWWLVGQRLTPVQLVGGAVLLGGAVLVQVAGRTRVPPEAEPVPDGEPMPPDGEPG